MPYNCQEIERLLDSDAEIGINWDDFEGHLASCDRCRALVTVEQVVAESLRSALPSPAPASNYTNIMESIKAHDTSAKSTSLVVRYLVPIVTGVISMVLVFFNKPLFDNAIKDLNLDFGKIWNYFSFAEQVKTSVIDEALRASTSPLLLTALLGMAFLIWFYSINDLEKLSK